MSSILALIIMAFFPTYNLVLAAQLCCLNSKIVCEILSIMIANGYELPVIAGMAFDPRYSNYINRKNITEGNKVRVEFTARGFMYNVRKIPIAGISSAQSTSRDV